MHKTYLWTGALTAAIAVSLGAFGAHALKQIVPPDTVSTFQTGVQYQMYHSLALLATGIIYERYPVKFIKWAGICFMLGIILFSGSLYLLSFLKIRESSVIKFVGPITPIGGIFFITGWLFLLAGVIRKK